MRTPSPICTGIYKDGQNVNIGTVDDNEPPHIRTLLLDNDTREHVASAEENVTLVDEIYYSGVRKNLEYTVIGRLVDADTGEDIIINGEPATASETFKAKNKEGTVSITYRLDATSLAGRAVVSFTSLYYGDEQLYLDDNILNRDETVSFPKIGTYAHGPNDEKEFVAAGEITVIDTVSYENLTPDMSYVLKASLINKNTGQVMKDGDGNEIRKEVTFKPETSSGTVDVEFIIHYNNFQNGATDHGTFVGTCKICGTTWEFENHEVLPVPYPHGTCPNCHQWVAVF